MSKEFAGKTVLITGAATGIGRATAIAFAQAGATVGVNHLGSTSEFQTLQRHCIDKPGSLIELEADVRDRHAVNNMVDRLVTKTGSLDGLINNAGISQIKPFLETTEEDWINIMDTDLKSVFLCCQAAIPYLIKTRGTIVNVASELAFTGRAKFALYTAAKGGVVSLSRSLALEFAPTVRVNVVAPGPTLTPLLEAEGQVPGHQESINDIPLGRYAEPEEIAQSILFLTSARGSYFCGDVISPNGGTVMR